MNFVKTVIFLCVLVPGVVMAQNSSMYVDDFRWTVTKVKTNYPGYNDKITDGSRLDAFTEEIEAKVAQAKSEKECLQYISEWLKYFKDYHLYMTLKRGPSTSSGSSDRLLSLFRFEQLDAETGLLVVPNFNIRYKPVIDSLIESNRPFLQRSPYLILDIRNNGGGSDESFFKLLPFVYTDPMIHIGSDIWSTEDNIKKYESLMHDTRYSEETRRHSAELVKKLSQHLNQFVIRDRDDTLRFSRVMEYPKKVFVLINGKVASSAEGFLLQVVQSRKVVLVGQHSRGELDYANVNFLDTPSGKFTLGCPTTRSRRVPEQAIDNIGVQPHVVLPAEEDWVRYVQQRKGTLGR